MGSPPTPYLQIVRGSRDLLFEFLDPSISLERFELENSTLASRLSTRGTNEKNAKLGQRGDEGVM